MLLLLYTRFSLYFSGVAFSIGFERRHAL